MRLRNTVVFAFITALGVALGSACGDDATTQTSVSAGGGAGAGIDGGSSGKDASGEGGMGAGGAAGSAGFGGQTGGSSGAAGTGGSGPTVCDPASKAARWAAMVQEPLSPLHGGAGVDLTGGDTWKGITLEEAEKINCKGKALGDPSGNGTLVIAWGDNCWAQCSTRKVEGDERLQE